MVFACQRLASVQNRPLTEELVLQLANALEGHILTADEDIRADGVIEDTFAFRDAETRAAALGVRGAYARGDSSSVYDHRFRLIVELNEHLA